MATVYLIRHHEPAVLGVFLGQLDVPLSERGRLHACSALPSLRAAVVYTSPLRRARETAAFLSPEPVVLDDLREIDFGFWSGKTWVDIEQNWPRLAQAKAADWLHVTPPGGESWEELDVRAGRAWHRIRSGKMPAAVVAHQAVNACLAFRIAGADPLTFQQAFGDVYRVEYQTD